MSIFLARVIKDFPEEMNIVGRLVVGYGEIEFGVALCLGAAIGNDDKAARILYRVPGETARMNVADAFMRDSYASSHLKAKYEEMIGAVRFCTTVRNRYAHSHWVAEKDGWLTFGNMQKGGDGIGDVSIPFTPINLQLLKQQETFFAHTVDLLDYLWRECEHLSGKSTSQRVKAPPVVPLPPIDNLRPKELPQT